MKRLVVTYVVLMALAIASWIAAPPSLAIPIAAVKALLIGAIFMDLVRAHAVARIAALIAVSFLALLCVGTYLDVLMR